MHNCNVFLELSDILEHGVEDALSVRHELAHLGSNILLNLRLAAICIPAEEIKVALQFVDHLSEPITLNERV